MMRFGQCGAAGRPSSATPRSIWSNQASSSSTERAFAVGNAPIAPARQIAENAGVDGAVIAGKLQESKDENHGFDAQNEKFVDMFKAGIIDPTKVVRAALQDASSVAGLLITTEAMVAEAPDENAGAAPAMPDMGGMGGMM